MILYDPISYLIYSDEAIYPINFASGQPGLVDMAPGGNDLHARIAGARALHHPDEDMVCVEDARAWPCPTHQVLTADLEYHAVLRAAAVTP